MKNGKRVLIILLVLLAIAAFIIGVLTYNINQTRKQLVIQEQQKLLSKLEFVDDYSTTGSTVNVYVNKLWLAPSDKEHIKWCKTVGLELDKIHSKYSKQGLGNVYMHVYINNDNGTVSELAWYKSNGEVELYYKH